MSEETKRKLSKAKKGQIPWITGKHHSAETRLKISEATKGRVSNNKGIKFSEEHKQRIGDANRGKPSPKKGTKLSNETRQRISEAQKGVNGHNWLGGISFEPYCEMFNNKFKESIREQFNRTCFICEKTEIEIMDGQNIKGKRPTRLAIHHVSYQKDCLCDDKKCEFVPLCASCHSKTNYDRDNWGKVIITKLKDDGYI